MGHVWRCLDEGAGVLVYTNLTDLGGPLSHSCVVAREYGIPTVVNVKRATELIRTGDRIRVDGSRGTVERLR